MKTNTKATRWFFAALMVSFLVTPSVSAQQQNLRDFWRGPAPREARVAEARRLLDLYTKLDSAIPTLSPKEDEWVTTEYKAALDSNGGRYNDRLFRVMNSREYNIKHVREWTVPIINTLRSVIQSEDRETLEWSSLAMLLTDEPSNKKSPQQAAGYWW